MQVKLTIQEYNILKTGPFIEKIDSIFWANDSCKISISSEVADEIRDWAGGQLQLIGFDKSWELTPIGNVLESLIDKMYA